MSILPLQNHHQLMPKLKGHSIGFLDTQNECESATSALVASGFPEAAICVLHAEDGMILWKRMMGRSASCKKAQDTLSHGMQELRLGHYALIVETLDRDEAILASMIAKVHGGHSFSQFGVLVGQRLSRRE